MIIDITKGFYLYLILYSLLELGSGTIKLNNMRWDKFQNVCPTYTSLTVEFSKMGNFDFKFIIPGRLISDILEFIFIQPVYNNKL